VSQARAAIRDIRDDLIAKIAASQGLWRSE